MVTTAEDVSVHVDVPRTSPDGTGLTYELVTAPAHGSIGGLAPSLTYSPEPNWHGTDRAVYRITAGSRSAEAEVTLVVTSVNDPPQASDVTVELPENSSLVVGLQGSDLDGDALTYEVVGGPSFGTFTGNGPSRLYTPGLDFTGSDSCTFRVVDPAGATAAGTVRLHVGRRLTLTSVTPDRGDRLGGTRLTITGARFSPQTQVSIAGQVAAGVALIDSKTLECDAPGGPLGYAKVVLSAPGHYPGADENAYFYEGWDDPRSNMVDVPGGTRDTIRPTLVRLPSGGLVCSWALWLNPGYEIRFATSSDGQSWSSSSLVATRVDVRESFLAVGPTGILACCWGEFGDRIVATVSTDGGLTWSAPTRLDDDPQSKARPTVAVEANGAVTCAWEDRRFGGKVMLSQSLDGGVSWSTNGTLEATLTNSTQVSPYLTRTSTGLACLYSELLRDAGGNTIGVQLALSRSSNGGATWSTVRVDDNPDPNHKTEGVLLETPGALHCAWRSRSWSYVRTVRSVDGGTTWSPSQVRAQGDTYHDPQLASDTAGTLVCAWQTEVFPGTTSLQVTRSLDGAVSWSAPLRLDDGPLNTVQQDPTLAPVSGGTFVAAWADARRSNFDILCSTSANGGSTWSASRRLDDDESENESQADCAVAFESDGSVLVAWEDGRNAYNDIVQTRSTDGGASWSANVVLDGPDLDSTSGSSHPSLVVDASGAWVVAWHRFEGSFGMRDKILVRRSTDRGASWSSEVLVNPITLNGVIPQLSVLPGGGLVCTWAERGSPTSMRFARSNDGGLTWSGATVIPTVESVARFSFAVSPSEWLCAWTESVGPTSVLYTGRSLDQGATWTRVARSTGTGSDQPFVVSLSREPSGAYSLAWGDSMDGVYFLRSTDGGVSWTSAVLLEALPGVGKVGLAAGTDGSLVVAWDDLDNPSQRSIHLRRSTTSGASWGPVDRLVYPLPPAAGAKTVMFDAVTAGPDGRFAIVGSNIEPPMDPVFVRGWFRP